MSLPKKLKNFNIFNDAHSYQGIAKEITLPKLTTKTEEWRGGGMDIPVDVDMGMEKLTAEWTVGGYVVQVLKQYGLTQAGGTLLRMTGAIQQDETGEVQAVEVVMRGRHTEIDMGSAASGEETEFKVISSLTYYKLTIAGEELVEIDAINMVKKIAGNDVLEPFRRALGI